MKNRIPISKAIAARPVTNPQGTMQHRVPIVTTCLVGAGLLAMAVFVSLEQKTLAQSPADPASATHSAHVAAAANQAGGQDVEAKLAEILARIEQLEANTLQQPGQPSAPSAMPMGGGNPPRTKPMSGGMAGMGGSPAVADQMAELRGKMQRLEAVMQRQSGASSGAMPMGGMTGMGSGPKPMPGKMAGMSGMSMGNSPSGAAPGTMKPAGDMGGMGGGTSGAGMGNGMMGMMDKMMGMMDKMMGGMGGGMSAGPMPAGAPMAGGGGMGMGMGMRQSEMGGMGGGARPAGAPATGMASSSGGMAMDKMEMAGMMGMGSMNNGAAGGMSQSAFPGFPGASHLYHIGSTGFFLDHSQHIALTTDQQAGLNNAKEQAALAKGTADRAIGQAEQELWTLTAADQPDTTQIEAKVAEIEKLKGDARLRFIGAVGEAAKILNDGQRMSLTGFAPPISAAPSAAPASPPMAGGMKDM